jgi:hypothetical protein
MATRRNDKIEPSKIVGAISKAAGTLIGSAVVTGKRIVRNVTLPKAGSSKLGGKSTQAPAKSKKKAAPKKRTKSQKAKKTTEIAKTASSSRKLGTSEKKSVQTPAGGKRKVTRKAETKGQKAKKNRQIAKRKATSPPQKSRASKRARAVTEQEPQPEVAEVELYSNQPRQAGVSANSVP